MTTTASVCASPCGPVPDQATRASLEEILDDPRLPTPPALALRIVDQASQPSCNPRDILALLRQDPGLCAKVLKTVNSSAFGFGNPIATLERAVAVLGLKPLRSLVLGLSLPAVHANPHDPLLGPYWQESVAGAVMARELAVQLRRPQAEEDLVAALLRDLGVPVLQEIFPAESLELRTGPRLSPADICTRETELFGVDHAEIAAGILESWRMPEAILLPVRFHHDPERLPDAPRDVQERTWILAFVTRLARLDAESAAEVGEVLALAHTRFGMDPVDLARFLESVRPKIQEFARVLEIDIGRCPNFAGIVSTGTEQLARLSDHGDIPAAAAGSSLAASSLLQTRAVRKDHTQPSPPRTTEPLPPFTADHLQQLPAGGARLNDYHVRALLGRGAMGVVFEATDHTLDRRVAIKMLTPERLVSSDARERFRREARAAAAVQHQNVVTIYAVQAFEGLPYLVMEYVPGASLQQRLDAEGTLPIADIVDYARQIASGLQAAHRRGVVHRDIKPANLLLDPGTQTIKISDFGLARLDGGVCLSQEGQWAGTPLFMAPEQFEGKGVDHRADLFSLGSVLYLLCTGRPPFDGGNLLQLIRKLAEHEPIAPRRLRADVPAWLEELIEHCHVKTTAGRIASAADVLAVIEANQPAAVRRRA